MAEVTPTPEEVAANVALAQAQADKEAAEAESLRAEARKKTAEALVAETNAKKASFDLLKAEYEESKRLASDEFHHIYRFRGQVDGSTVGKCLAQLSTWHRLDPKSDIEIVFSSPGGSILDGFELFDYIQFLKQEGHYVVTSTQGMAASMAGVLLQAGNKRVMGKSAWLLIHEASFGTGGSVGQVEDTVEWVKMMQDRILDIFAERSVMSRRDIRKNWTRKDWWMGAETALKHGFVDELA